MLFIKYLIMEALESIVRGVSKLSVKRSERHDVREIGEQGVFVVENFLPESDCNTYMDLIDDYIADNENSVWRDEVGADERIYFAEKHIPVFSDFFCDEFIRKVLKGYTGCSVPVGFVLGNKLSLVDGNLGSGGGWHRDTLVSHQFKAILYLSDVTSNNGPFQYVRGSNRKRSLLKAFFRGESTFGKTRFSDAEIQTHLDLEGNDVMTFTGKKGTLLLVDTKGIHRGMPLSTGHRYALTTYFWKHTIPQHIKNLEIGV